MSTEEILVPKDHDEILDHLQQLGVDEEVLRFISANSEAFNLFWHFWQDNWTGITDAQKKDEVNQLIAFIRLVIKAERNK